MSDIAMTEQYSPPATPVALDASIRYKYSGTGGELFGQLIVGLLLTAVTFGLYGPWFVVGLWKYIFSRTTLQTGQGDLKFEFTGTGGDLFVRDLSGTC